MTVTVPEFLGGAAPAPAPAPAPGPGPGLSKLVDSQFAGFSAYDFLTTGGSGGSGGDGPHTVDGVSFYLVGSVNLTQCEFDGSTGLLMSQGPAGAAELAVDLRALANALEPKGPVHVMARAASVVSSGTSNGVQMGIHRSSLPGVWSLSDPAVRYRKTGGTADMYAITYNGTSWDAFASGTVTDTTDCRMQLSMTALQGAVARADAGTAADPADWDTVPELYDVDYAEGIGAHTGYPGDTNVWAWVGGAGTFSATFKSLIVYGLEA